MALIASTDIEPSVFPSNLISQTTPPIDWSALDQTSSGGGDARGAATSSTVVPRLVGQRAMVMANDGGVTGPLSPLDEDIDELIPSPWGPNTGARDTGKDEGKAKTLPGTVGETSQKDDELVPSPSRLSQRKKGKAMATEEPQGLGRDTGKLVTISGKKGNVSGKRLTKPGNKRKARGPSTDEELMMGKQPSSGDGKSSDDELLLQPRLRRPVLKKARTTTGLRQPSHIFSGVLVPGRPDGNFNGMIIDEDVAVDPAKAPKVIGAVRDIFCYLCVTDPRCCQGL